MQDLLMGIKWLGLEADNSPPSSAKVKDAWSIPPLTQCLQGIH